MTHIYLTDNPISIVMDLTDAPFEAIPKDHEYVEIFVPERYMKLLNNPKSIKVTIEAHHD